MSDTCKKTEEERRIARNTYKKELYRDRKLWGMCVICGKRLTEEETTLCCTNCRIKQRKNAEKHKDKISEQRKRFREKHKELGLCLYCNQPATANTQLCDYHRNYYAEMNKLRSKRKTTNKQAAKQTSPTNS